MKVCFFLLWMVFSLSIVNAEEISKEADFAEIFNEASVPASSETITESQKEKQGTLSETPPVSIEQEGGAVPDSSDSGERESNPSIGKTEVLPAKPESAAVKEVEPSRDMTGSEETSDSLLITPGSIEDVFFNEMLAPRGKPRKPLVLTDGGFLFDLSAEYRFRTIYIKPLELSGKDAAEVLYGVQRGRTKWTMGYKDYVKLVTELDLVAGALFGDNGKLTGDAPYPNDGMSTTARTPNNAGIGMGLKPGEDPLEADSYTYDLVPIDPVNIRRIWGEVSLMALVLRVGRQPASDGRGILLNNGDNDDNRFGVCGSGQTADRISLGTKPLEIAKAISAHSASAADTREDRGFFIGFAYDHLVYDNIASTADDARQFGGSIYYLQPEFTLGNVSGGDLKLSYQVAYRYSKAVDLKLLINVLELKVRLADFHFEAQAAVTSGETREISDALSLIRQRTPTKQDVLGWGMFMIADYDVGPVTFTLEFDYATGDSDPRPDNTVKNFYFSEDTQVGLLLFPHVLAYETARSAAAATANLKGLGADSLPSTRMATKGAVHNAIIFFPQLTYNITETIFLRGGVLAAWTQEPLVDPYSTLRREDGERIDDDAINYHGGKPGDYYGTEFDLRLSIKLWREYFLFDLEGALLLPGDALYDINGDAAMSGLIEGRITFRF